MRLAGHRVLGPVPVKIRGGVNKGRRWSLASLGRGFGAGTFESLRLEAIASLVDPGDCFWDVGAHRGYVSLAASRAVGTRGSIVAIEPSEDNLRFLRQHLIWNEIENVQVIPTAVSDAAGETAFGGPGSSIAFRLHEGPETVRVVTAASLVDEEAAPAPTFMKIDVEGAEAGVLRGAGDLLTDTLRLLVSVHTRELYAECTDVLATYGFSIYESGELARRMAEPEHSWIGDVDFLAVGAEYELDRSALATLRLFQPT